MLDDTNATPTANAQFCSYQGTISHQEIPWMQSFVRLKFGVKEKPEEIMIDCGPAEHKREIDIVMRRFYQQHVYKLQQEEEIQMRHRRMQEGIQRALGLSNQTSNSQTNTPGYSQSQVAQYMSTGPQYAPQTLNANSPYPVGSAPVYAQLIPQPQAGHGIQPTQLRLMPATNMSELIPEAAIASRSQRSILKTNEGRAENVLVQRGVRSAIPSQTQQEGSNPDRNIGYSIVQARADASSVDLGGWDTGKMRQTSSQIDAVSHSQKQMSESSDAPSTIFSEEARGSRPQCEMEVMNSSHHADQGQRPSTPPTDIDEKPAGPETPAKGSPTLSDIIGSETPSESSYTETSDPDFNPQSPTPQPRAHRKAKLPAQQGRRMSMRSRR